MTINWRYRPGWIYETLCDRLTELLPGYTHLRSSQYGIPAEKGSVDFLFTPNQLGRPGNDIQILHLDTGREI